MFRPLTILQKGILIVSIPVLAQGVFVGILLSSMSEARTAERWAVHTKEVIAKIEETYRLLLGSYAGVPNLIVLQNPIDHDPFSRDLDEMQESLAELRALVADNPPQQARIDALIAKASGFAGLLGALESSVENGERARAVDQLGRAAETLREMRTQVDDVRAEESRLDRIRIKSLETSNAWHVGILSGGGIATLGLTMVLASFFFNRVVKRLEVLRENSRLLAQGQALNPPLTGGDELALLDRDFRAMASSLAEQKQENEMFVYSVSHDLRSPLTNLQGFSEELRLSSRGAAMLRAGVQRLHHQAG
jgi:signal transduction histidine kinase